MLLGQQKPLRARHTEAHRDAHRGIQRHTCTSRGTCTHSHTQRYPTPAGGAQTDTRGTQRHTCIFNGTAHTQTHTDIPETQGHAETQGNAQPSTETPNTRRRHTGTGNTQGVTEPHTYTQETHTTGTRWVAFAKPLCLIYDYGQAVRVPNRTGWVKAAAGVGVRASAYLARTSARLATP